MIKVFILATCRKNRLFPATELVFKTLRIGFPTAQIFVHGNALRLGHHATIASHCRVIGAQYTNMDQPMAHDAWIELLCRSNEPFWIVDTDVIFTQSVEGWEFQQPLSGEFQDEWFCEYTKCLHRARLHTALMRFDPVGLRARQQAFLGLFRLAPFAPKLELIRQHYAPVRKLDGELMPYFYDTCAGLYHATGGQAFTEEQNAAFVHLQAGTYCDLSAPFLSVEHYEEKLIEICRHPELAASVRADQKTYFAKCATKKE